MDITQTQLDSDVVNLAKATRTIESGNNPTIRGKSGEYGYYQYTPNTWATQSKSAGVNVPLEQATPEQQNEVWYKWAKAKKDAGNNIGQIASMQNAGEEKPNAYLEGNSGTNSYGVKYDTAAYAKQVAEEYQKLKSDQSGTNSQIQSPVLGKTFAQSIPNASQDKQPTAAGKIIRGLINSTGIPSIAASGANLVQTIEGKPTTDTFHNSYLGDVSRVGKDFDPAKGFFGSENKQNRQAVLDSAEKGAELATTIGAGEALGNSGKVVKGILGKSVLESPAVETALKEFDLPLSDFKTLKAGDKLEYLTQSLKGASAANKAVIQQAINEITPQAIKEAGGKIAFSKAHPIISKLLGLAGSAAKTAIAGTILGKAINTGQQVSGLLK